MVMSTDKELLKFSWKMNCHPNIHFPCCSNIYLYLFVSSINNIPNLKMKNSVCNQVSLIHLINQPKEGRRAFEIYPNLLSWKRNLQVTVEKK